MDPGQPSAPAAPVAPVKVVNAAPPTGKGVKAGSCAGFKNTVGINASTITIGNVADITGPVPGFFTPAMQAVKAYVAYFNSTSNICGRKLAMKSYDSQTNTSADAVATQKTCDETFAAVGSMAAFDSGGAVNASKCGIPEIHAIVTNPERAACRTCFGAEAPLDGHFQKDLATYFVKKNKAATQKAAMLYPNAAAAVNGAKTQARSQERNGWKFVYKQGFDIAEFNYGPYVQRLKQTGARIVEMYGSSDMAIRMARAFQSANYKPDLFLLNASQYDRNFASGGSAVDGAIVYVDFTPLEEAASTPELKLYMQWLQQVAPGAQPTYFGLFAWSAARLFAEQATVLGGKLTRANLVKRLQGVHSWTANGLHAPQDVGRKIATECVRFLQLRGGAWKPYGPTKYLCSGRTSGK
ncbi:ABC transporter substrate-binding protein [Marmoricola sp. OAE513]|uniref:ABC transporter substrate-binding protein n=1 Tax=Marmoricola sp. OAE513 TaxID=2817894 RepID=UPI001AE2AA83